MSESEVPQVSRPVVTPVRLVIALCLLAPLVGTLWVSSYARISPEFIGIPFFYWYQMLWVLISTALTMIAYKLWQYDQRSRGAAAAGRGAAADGAAAREGREGGELR